MHINERLRAARIAAGFETAAAAADRFGWNHSAYRHHENGIAAPKLERLAEYAQAYGVTVDWLLKGAGEGPAALVKQIGRNFVMQPLQRSVPVVGEVQAGTWREVATVDPFDAQEQIAINVQGYERAQLFALRVVGNSMNVFYPSGRYIICAPPAEAGMRDGDHVVVQRSRAGLVETTVKELVINPRGRTELWPRSTDPEFQTPIILRGDGADQDAPEVIGIVVADYGKRQRPPAPFS